MERTKAQASETAEQLRERMSAVADQAKTQVSEAIEPLKQKAWDAAEEQKKAGADRLSSVARAIEHAAEDLEHELPLAASYIREAAARVERASATVRDRSMDELVHQADQFARHNTLAFFAGSVLAGFALSRFLKSSAPHARSYARHA
jgi:hypothetical protein